VHPPRQEDVSSSLYLQGDFDDGRADCGLFDWFLRGHGEVHLRRFQFPRHILSLLVAQRCQFGLHVGMMSGQSSPRQK